MGESEHHHHVLLPGVRDGVPYAGRDEQALPGRERNVLVVETELAASGQDVRHLFGVVLEASMQIVDNGRWILKDGQWVL